MTQNDLDTASIFFEIHSDMPRQGVGSAHSTLRALEFAEPLLPDAPFIADFGCGPGPGTLVLANALPRAQFLCVDRHEPFIEALINRATAQGCIDRVTAVLADMGAPPCAKNSLDMIWCEGALYNLGIENGLELWRDYLKPGGCVAFSEPVWTSPPDQRPDELVEFWAAYPQMRDGPGIEAIIAKTPYRLLGGFDLPHEDWWTEYYDPLQERVEMIAAHYAGKPVATGPVNHTSKEIALRKAYPDHYGYRFFIVQLAD